MHFLLGFSGAFEVIGNNCNRIVLLLSTVFIIQLRSGSDFEPGVHVY